VHPYQVIPNKGTYDFMSYCAAVRGGGDPGNWISAQNYQALLNGDFLTTLPAKDLRSGQAHGADAVPSSGVASVASLDPSHLRVRAFVDRTGVQIASVGPRIGPPLPTGTSAFTRRRRCAGADGLDPARRRAATAAPRRRLRSNHDPLRRTRVPSMTRP
jgi:hypothetical protein